MPEPILAWHFLREDRHTRFEPRMLVEPGQKMTVAGPPIMCRHGLHASIRAIEALAYSPGNIICRVELSGQIVHDCDKLCATERKCLWMADATVALHEFAFWCAEHDLLAERAAGREPDVRLWNVIEKKRKWIKGEICSFDLATAWAYAYAAARKVSEQAARGSSQDTIADCSAGLEAARAASDAARCGLAAILDEANIMLEEMLMKLGPE